MSQIFLHLSGAPFTSFHTSEWPYNLFSIDLFLGHPVERIWFTFLSSISGHKWLTLNKGDFEKSVTGVVRMIGFKLCREITSNKETY